MVTKENQEKLDNLNEKIIEIKSKQLLNVEEESLLTQLTTEKSTLEGKLNQHYRKNPKDTLLDLGLTGLNKENLIASFF